jgi:type II secretory pathway pseudopilin PulG
MRAFTLIETMIAITILILAVVGPMVTAGRAIVAAEIARDQLVGSYLAQEGVEFVRGLRDNAFLATYKTGVTTWWTNNFLPSVAQCDGSPPNPSTQACTLDPTNNTLAQCTIGTDCLPLHLSSGPNSLYTQQNIGAQTIFTRTIQVVQISGTEERVTSRVTWSFHGTPYTVTITSNLTPWQ